jgi:cytochrome c biogenesis protein CcmG, thiol:disulfide interchange protein DsbE
VRLVRFAPLIVFAALALLLWRGLSQDPNYMPSALEGRALPAFELRTLDGAAVTPADLRGRPALLNVWATWCPACAEEHAYLMQLASTGTAIFGVNYKDDDNAARRWLAAKGNPYRLNIVDRDGRLGLDLGVTGAPETYVLDGEGVVHMRYQGPVDERVWREKFAPLLSALRGGARP